MTLLAPSNSIPNLPLHTVTARNAPPHSRLGETKIFTNEEVNDDDLGEALQGDITDNPLDIYMRVSRWCLFECVRSVRTWAVDD